MYYKKNVGHVGRWLWDFKTDEKKVFCIICDKVVGDLKREEIRCQ